MCNLGEFIEPEHCKILSFLGKRDRRAIRYFIELFDKNPHFETLSIYEGMGHWIYLHKNTDNKLFQLYLLENCELEDHITDAIIKPFDFYQLELFHEDTMDFIFVGVDKKYSVGKKIENEWKINRIGR